MPGFSVSGAKNRPAAAVTPRVEKYSGETRCPKNRSALPPLSPENATANGTIGSSAVLETVVWLWSR